MFDWITSLYGFMKKKSTSATIIKVNSRLEEIYVINRREAFFRQGIRESN